MATLDSSGNLGLTGTRRKCNSRNMLSLAAKLDRSNVVDVDLGSAEFKANAYRYMTEWARRRPFYVLGKGPPQVVVGRYADVHRVFSDTESFKSEMPRGPGWEQFNKIMFAQFVTQMDGEHHARVRRLLLPAFSIAPDRAARGEHHQVQRRVTVRMTPQYRKLLLRSGRD